MVLKNGEAVEKETRENIFQNPQHIYTKQLFNATPVTDTNAIRARVARRKAARVI
jgi:dipeptide transport system ATP-binding protein